MFCFSQPQVPSQRSLIRPAAQWGGSTSQSQASGPGPSLVDSHLPHTSVASAQPTSGNQAIGVFTTDQNAVPSTSREVVVLGPHFPAGGSVPRPNILLPSSHPTNPGTSLFTPAIAELPAQPSTGNQVAVACLQRTDRLSGALALVPPQERPVLGPQSSQTGLEPEVMVPQAEKQHQGQFTPPLSPATILALEHMEQPGSSAASLLPAPQPFTVEVLVKKVVSPQTASHF